MANRISHRYDYLPLLPSGPGGFDRSWSYRFAETKLVTYEGNSNVIAGFVNDFLTPIIHEFSKDWKSFSI